VPCDIEEATGIQIHNTRIQRTMYYSRHLIPPCEEFDAVALARMPVEQDASRGVLHRMTRCRVLYPS